MPTGPGTVTVTYKGVVSATFGIQVVAAATGITVFNGSGVVQHAITGALVTYTASAAPNEIITIWGTGFGATGNSDTAYDTLGTSNQPALHAQYWRRTGVHRL